MAYGIPELLYIQGLRIKIIIAYGIREIAGYGIILAVCKIQEHTQGIHVHNGKLIHYDGPPCSIHTGHKGIDDIRLIILPGCLHALIGRKKPRKISIIGVRLIISEIHFEESRKQLILIYIRSLIAALFRIMIFQIGLLIYLVSRGRIRVLQPEGLQLLELG